MGCGGSKVDALEPRYYESWTRQTESTWLANTDAETHQVVIINKANNPGCMKSTGHMKENATIYAGKGAACRPSQWEKKMVNAGTQCGMQPHAVPALAPTTREDLPAEMRPDKVGAEEGV
ncbi:hypothetical protein COCON_G00127700 [Conger conger]|uniref:Uncharacterized protein n=1 Tax=Conger conger TaxID=82655 RepID=A0A9Q1DD71_CONCO|nr:hypothetical protein COCON_G00127700 [Conger conger]